MRIAIGTDQGVIILESADGFEWYFVSHAQQGRQIQCLVESDNQSILATGAHGAIYKTIDYKNWLMSNDGLEGQHISALCIHPYNPHIVYAGTTPPKIFCSASAGVEWVQLNSFNELASASSWSYPEPPYHAMVKGLVLHPEYTNVVLVGVARGGFVGSLDYGATWMERSLNIESELNGLTMHPAQPNRLFAPTSTGIYRSDDLGSTWEHVSRGLPYLYTRCLTISPGNPDQILACISEARQNSSQQMVALSNDGGETWNIVTRGLPVLAGDAITCVSSAGQQTFAFGTAQGNVFFTDNGGKFWRQIRCGTVRVNAILLQEDLCQPDANPVR